MFDRKIMSTMRYIFSLSLAIICILAQAQLKQRKLGTPLNNPSFNYWAPFVSLDGNTLLFTSDYTEDGLPATFLSVRQGVDWKEPFLVPKKVTALSYTKAFTLSHDGKIIYITSSRGGTQGGYDIWVSQFSGNTFSEVLSIGAPVNSPLNEASPSLSPDGNTLFFMRCKKMSNTGADECKIMMAKKNQYGLWDTVTELPEIINAGNSQMPRMLADGQTLLFSSNRHQPNKGGMDFYISRFADNRWGTPINLDFANTLSDDVYASASSVGFYLLKDAPGAKRSELVEFQFPPEIKPKAVVRVAGLVEGLTDPSKANVNLIIPETKTILFTIRPDAKGNFVCYIPEGNLYDLYVDPPMENFRYFSKRYDLTGKKLPNSDRITATLKPLASGDEMELSTVSFKKHSSGLDPISKVELQKIARMMRGNPSLNYTVDVSLYGLMKDSIQSEDLTEVISDTVIYEMEVQIDSVTTEMRDSIAVEYTYHNDRTQQQAEAIASHLIGLGVAENKITITYMALEEPVADNRRTVIKLKAR